MLSITEAAQAIANGEVIAVPTEAVYGLSCDPNNTRAVHQILAIKQRPVDKGMILVAGSVSQLDDYVDWDRLTPERIGEIQASWPGPYTWIVPVKPTVSKLVTGAHNSLAVRVTDHPVMAELCLHCRHPLISTSANLSGEDPVKSVEALHPDILQQVAGVVQGGVGRLAKPTQIREAMSGKVLR